MAKKRHKYPELDHVKYVLARGKWYAYFNTGRVKENGRPVYTRMPHPSEPSFYGSYASLMAGRTRRAKAAYTVASLLDDYQRSAEYGSKALGTQISYQISMDKIRKFLGHFAVDNLTDEAVQLPLDTQGWGASTQNLFVAVLRNAYKWGRSARRNKTKLKPMDDYDRQKTGQHEPWPADILAQALKHKDAQTRLAVHLLYYTGQRIGDVCKMLWADVQDDGTIYVRQQKTGKEVWPPMHSALQAQIAQTPKRGLTILCNDMGKRLTVDTLRSHLQAMTEAMGTKTVPHGLRKNAVNALLEVGCSIAEVSAITGQTMQTVEHYAAKVNRRALGQAAILKWDKRA